MTLSRGLPALTPVDPDDENTEALQGSKRALTVTFYR